MICLLWMCRSIEQCTLYNIAYSGGCTYQSVFSRGQCNSCWYIVCAGDGPEPGQPSECGGAGCSTQLQYTGECGGLWEGWVWGVTVRVECRVTVWGKWWGVSMGEIVCWSDCGGADSSPQLQRLGEYGDVSAGWVRVRELVWGNELDGRVGS